jgi:hypothetical protein
MAEQDPDKAERMSEEIKAKLYSPGPKESLVTDQLIQVLRNHKATGGV